jgi:hypothetical protein
MKSETGFQFWPGYVAAISCLVLGLLLVASVVASLTTQLGLIAADVNSALLAQAFRRAAARAEAQAQGDAAAVARPAAAATAVAVAPPSVAPPLPLPAEPPVVPLPAATAPAALPQAAVDNHLTLIFGEQVSGIPPERRPEIAASLRELTVAPGSSWRVWATAPDGELARRRSTFRLMVAVRTFLAEQGIPERAVELRLLEGPVTGNPGDIVVRVGPAQAGVTTPAAAAAARP